MNTTEKTLYKNMAAALINNDAYGMGYQLVALSQLSLSPRDIKEMFLSWLAFESIANCPHNIEHYSAPFHIEITKRNEAIVYFLKANLNKNLSPSKFVEELAYTGRFLMNVFEHIEEGASTPADRLMNVLTKPDVIAGFEPFTSLTSQNMEFMLLPGITRANKKCARVIFQEGIHTGDALMPWFAFFGDIQEPYLSCALHEILMYATGILLSASSKRVLHQFADSGEVRNARMTTLHRRQVSGRGIDGLGYTASRLLRSFGDSGVNSLDSEDDTRGEVDTALTAASQN